MGYLLTLTAHGAINTTDVKYTLHGKGAKKVIVLHSWMDDSNSWSAVIPHLNMEDYSYAFMDVRGYGKSKHIKGQYTSDEIAEDIFSVAKDLGWKAFYLVGHSMTGMAVQKAALKDTNQQILKIIAITPVSSAGFPVDEENLNFFKSIVHNEKVTQMAFGIFTSNRLSKSWYANRAKQQIAATDAKAQLAYIDMWTQENFADQMKSVTTPFLVMTGHYDHPGFMLPAQQKAFENFKNVTFLEIENAGHFPMHETPLFLAARIEAFFSEN